MNAMEKRQTQRIVRNAREAERHLFELVDELQLAAGTVEEPYDWQSASSHLGAVEATLDILQDLVRHVRQELKR